MVFVETTQYALDLFMLQDRVGGQEHVACDRIAVLLRIEQVFPHVVQPDDAQQVFFVVENREIVVR